MSNKFLAALSFTMLSGIAFAATDNPSSSTSSTARGTNIPFSELDTNKDNALTKDELQRVPAIANNFDQIDFNGDGKIIEPDYYALLSALEVGRAPALPEHATLDVNKDGTVELAEYDAFRLRLKDLDNLMLSGTLKSTTTASPGARESQGASVTAPPSTSPAPTTP